LGGRTAIAIVAISTITSNGGNDAVCIYLPYSVIGSIKDINIARSIYSYTTRIIKCGLSGRTPIATVGEKAGDVEEIYESRSPDSLF
jgi:cadmium resistance protein CadD (predicted permease)